MPDICTPPRPPKPEPDLSESQLALLRRIRDAYEYGNPLRGADALGEDRESWKLYIGGWIQLGSRHARDRFIFPTTEGYRALHVALTAHTCPACPNPKDPGETYCSERCEWEDSTVDSPFQCFEDYEAHEAKEHP